jgi:hypothetical protein
MLSKCLTDRQTDFSVSCLNRTSFRGTSLENVDLVYVASMYGAYLFGARLDGTEIRYELFGGRIGEEVDKSYLFASKAYAAIKANLESSVTVAQPEAESRNYLCFLEGAETVRDSTDVAANHASTT